MELMNNATVIGGGTLSIDQLLRAAQLLEQQSTAFKLAASAEHQHHHQQQQQQQSVVVQEHFQQQINGGLFGKLGEKYQERYVMSKIRPVHLEQPVAASAFHAHHHHHGYSSTGSSRRSTPTSSIFSASASNCSSPNSPVAATTSAAAAPLAANPAGAAANISQQLLFAQPPQQTFVTTGVNQTQQIPAPTCSISSSSSLISAVLQSPSSSFASTSTFIPSASASPQTITETGNGAVSFNVRQSRAAHNELEKNRRANLRGYLDKLKSVLPPDTDSTRDTTLSLLTRARNHIRTVKQEKNVLMERRNALFTEHLRLRQQLDALNASAASECAQRSSAAQAQCQQEQKPQPVETEMLEPQIAKQHDGESASSTTALHFQEQQQEQPYVSAFTPVVAGSNNGCAEQQRQQQEESAFPISKPSPLKTTAVDLYMDGLLPALPLLYPYTDLVARHALVSNMLIAAANAAVSVKNPLSS